MSDALRSFVRRLTLLDSVEEVEQAVTTGEELRLEDLQAAFEAEEAALGPHDEAERELVRFVRGIAERRLAPVDPRAAADPVEAACVAAARAPSLFAAYEVVRPHRGALTAEHLTRARRRAMSVPSSRVKPGELAVNAVIAIACALGEDRAKADALRLWGARCREEGRLAAAGRRFARSIELSRKLGDPDLELDAAALASSLAVAMSDWERAQALLEWQIGEAERRDQHAFAFSARRSLVGVLHKQGRYSGALELLERQLAYLEPLSILPEGAVFKARALLVRGLVLEDVGQLDEGDACYEEALAIAQWAANPQLIFEAQTSRAGNATKRGDGAAAIARLQELVVMVKGWGDAMALASTRNNLGNAYLRAGRPRDALREFAGALATKQRGTLSSGLAIAHMGLGDAYDALRSRDLAMRHHLTAAAVAARLGDPEVMAICLQKLGGIGEVASQLRPLATAIRTAASANGDQRVEAMLTRLLASAAIEEGDERAAIALYRETLARVSDDERSMWVRDLESSLGAVLIRDPETAREGYEVLRRAVDAADRALAEATADEQRAEIAGRFADAYAALVDVLARAPEQLTVADARAEGFRLHEQVKSRAFVAELAGAGVVVPAAVPAELREREAELLEIERGLQRWDHRSGELSVAYRRRRLREVDEALRGCWDEIARHAPGYVRMRRGDPVDLGELRETLVESADGPTAVLSLLCGSATTVAFVVRSDDPDLHAFSIPLGRDAIADAVRTLRRAFDGDATAFPPFPPVLRDQPQRRDAGILERLGADLLAFLPALEGVELICGAPHGPLHGVPLHALRSADGELLADRHAVTYAPSVTALLYCLRRGREPTGGERPRAFVAGTSTRDDPHAELFEHDAALFDAASWDLEAHAGVEATPERVRAALAQADVGHVTCHGLFEPARPLDSALVLADGDTRPPGRIRSLSLRERRPFLLTARMLLETRVRAELVTLRACSTGVQGERNRGDELDGMTRSLIYAGADTVMVSLWNVDRDSSRELMRHFYDAWAAGRGVPKWRALWEAQRRLRADATRPYLAHPYHWAPMVLTGDWR